MFHGNWKGNRIKASIFNPGSMPAQQTLIRFKIEILVNITEII